MTISAISCDHGADKTMFLVFPPTQVRLEVVQPIKLSELLHDYFLLQEASHHASCSGNRQPEIVVKFSQGRGVTSQEFGNLHVLISCDFLKACGGGGGGSK